MHRKALGIEIEVEIEVDLRGFKNLVGLNVIEKCRVSLSRF
jgi:hypothetical protein